MHDIVFAYRNSDFLYLLKKRGSAVSSRKWSKVSEINRQLTEMAKEKYEDLTTPVMAFMTMRKETPARKLFQSGGIDILEEFCSVWKPKNPNDIILENQAVNVKWQFFRKIILLISTMFIFTNLTLMLAKSESYFV